MSPAQNEGAARRARLPPAQLALALAGPVALALAAWVYVATVMRDMPDMAGVAGMAMPMPAGSLGAGHLLGVAAMWLAMMTAMMLPTALPMIVTYARLRAAGSDAGPLAADVALFAGGYVAMWSALSLAATALQAILTGYGYLSTMTLKLDSAPLSGAVLVAAGIYQWLPLKNACLGRCRSPIGFFMTVWRDGPAGALAMGWRHGLFCVGCCWALMALLFVAGAMNPLWMVLLTGYMLAEKVVPYGAALARASGAALVAGGVWLILV